MGIFEDVEVTWKSKTKTVPSEKVMTVLARIEDKVTFVEANRLVADAVNNGSRKQVFVASVYSDFLSSCGFKVSAEEVISTLDFSAYVAALMEIIGLLKLTLAPDERERYESLISGGDGDGDDEPKEPDSSTKKK